MVKTWPRIMWEALNLVVFSLYGLSWANRTRDLFPFSPKGEKKRNMTNPCPMQR